MPDNEPLRADALANRGRILDAADDVFSRGGEAASTEEVARLAGVGIATVFRHFPTKAALLEAVLVRRFERLRDRASKLEHHDDPGAAFFEVFAQIVSDASGKIAIAEAVVAAGGEHERARHASEQLRESIGVLLRRAQDAEAVRADVALDEVYALLVATSRAAASMQLDGGVRARLLAVLFDGLRAPRR
jgi:AcrR family transcriptional regulator